MERPSVVPGPYVVRRDGTLSRRYITRSHAWRRYPPIERVERITLKTVILCVARNRQHAKAD